MAKSRDGKKRKTLFSGQAVLGLKRLWQERFKTDAGNWAAPSIFLAVGLPAEADGAFII